MSTPPPPPPPPPPPERRPFDQDEEDPLPERQTVRIVTYRDAVHVRQQLDREGAAWRAFWTTLVVGIIFFALLVAAWWSYTTWFRGGFIEPYNDPEPPTIPRDSQP